MDEDCSEFIPSCLHGITGKARHKIPRPISATIHRVKPNHVTQFEYLYMGQGIGNLKYHLVIRNNCSSYLCIIQATNADAKTAEARFQNGSMLHCNASMGMRPRFAFQEPSYGRICRGSQHQAKLYRRVFSLGQWHREKLYEARTSSIPMSAIRIEVRPAGLATCHGNDPDFIELGTPSSTWIEGIWYISHPAGIHDRNQTYSCNVPHDPN